VLRSVLLLIDALMPLVPRSHRDIWREQWRAELWHYAAWLARERRGSRAAALLLIARWSGAIPHAAVLRLSGWSPRMILHDLKFAWRLFVRRPAFTAVAILILALGIGANATIFSWVETVLLNPLSGVAAQDRLVAVRGTYLTRTTLASSYPNFVDLRNGKVDGFDDLMAFRILALSVRTDGEPMRVFGELVTTNFFDLLGVTATVGRGFREEEGQAPGRDPVIVISHALWTRVFAADPAVIGRSMTVNGTAFTVVGVAARDFHGSAAGLALDAYVPITMQKSVMSGDRLGERGNSWLQVYGRLSPDATLDRANAGLRVAAGRLAAVYPQHNEGRGLLAVPLSQDGASGLLMPVMSTLMAVVGLVLLIACANLAGLLLARSAGRQREVAVRLAVGAGRGRLVRQLLIENLLLATAGGVAGLVIASWTSRMLTLFIPPTPFPVSFDSGLNLTVIVFTVAVTLITAIVSGLLPALRGSRPDVAASLKDAAPGNIGGGKGRLRQGLVVSQVALSLLLLVSAALFLRSLTRAQSLDTGYAARQGLLTSIDLLAAGYDEARGQAFLQQTLDRVAAIPGVRAASVASALPLDISAGADMSFDVDGYTAKPNEEMQAYYNRVGPNYFDAMGIDLMQGRGITARDTRDQPLVVVINETMAERYFRGRSAIGGTIRFGRGPATVVGVARSGKYSALNEAPRNYMYLSVFQVYRPDLVLHVRTVTDPLGVFPAVQREIRALDPALPLFDVRTLEEHRRLSVFIPKMAGTLLGLFGVLALVLAVVGLYGVVACTVAQRTREIGVRMALGAAHRDIVRLVLRQGLVLAGAGLVAGLGLALAAGRLIAGQLVGISGADPVSFFGPAALLLIVAAAACALPARRAARLDPLTALRQE
jgi:predicted permease